MAFIASTEPGRTRLGPQAPNLNPSPNVGPIVWIKETPMGLVLGSAPHPK